ncbi:MAG TPA: cupin domain-containing protein [Edaphobacter sp.]|nr:cupin domain-containing protein [Edaphobacter sp.]
MPAESISRKNAQHYTWGSGCDGWFLVRTPDLNIIEEQMPPGTSETRHHHERARQFFFVLEGELTMEVEHKVLNLQKGEGVEIAPGLAHQAINQSASAVRFLVTSQPPSHGDRIEACD